MARHSGQAAALTPWDWYLAKGACYAMQLTQAAVAANNSECWILSPQNSNRIVLLYRAIVLLGAAGLVDMRTLASTAVAGSVLARPLTPTEGAGVTAGSPQQNAAQTGTKVCDNMVAGTQYEFSNGNGLPIGLITPGSAIIFSPQTQNVACTLQAWLAIYQL